MHASVALDNSEAAILARVFEADQGDLAPDAARFFLHADFPPSDRARMDSLARKARQGILTVGEQEELEHYCHVGDLLALMQSKARMVVKQSQHKC